MPRLLGLLLLVGWLTGVPRVAGAESPALPSPPRSAVAGTAPSAPEQTAAADTLRAAASARGRHIGTAVVVPALREEARYRDILAREFDLVTTEDTLKFAPVHPAPEQYAFAGGDAIVDFAQAHGLQVRGHTLVWHHQLPDWLTQGGFSRDELLTLLHTHIQTVVQHYRGRIVAWDVVNEAIADDGTLRDTFWLRGIGPEYLDLAFRWTHEADPDARLFLNDFGGEGLGRKSDAIYALVRRLRQDGVPLDGVGFQMHIAPERAPGTVNIAANIDRLAALGVEVHITEMDVRLPLPVTAEALESQARLYRDILDVCLRADACTALVFWGFTDRHSWIARPFPGHGAALIFDENYVPKPAYYALLNGLRAT